MMYCDYCQVHLRGEKEKCPLCGNIISQEDTKNKHKFHPTWPEIPPTYESHLAFRILLFISITAVVLSLAIDIIFPSIINWPVLIVFGLISMWLSLSMVVKKRHNIPKNIMCQVTIVSILSVFWDWKMGWKGWSLEYVIPTVCIAAMFVMYVTAKIMKVSVRDYITYFLLDGLFGIVPILFILFKWVDFLYPSIVCIAVSIIFLSAILIFQGDNIKMELTKRMHI